MSLKPFHGFAKKSFEVFERMFLRSVVLALLTFVGFALVDYLVESGMTDRYALVRRFPEFIPFMMAAAKLTFIEMSLFWVRFGVNPRCDVQELASFAASTSTGAAVVHLSNTLVWIVRIGVFLYLVS